MAQRLKMGLVIAVMMLLFSACNLGFGKGTPAPSFGENVAFGKPTDSSSHYAPNTADRAVDGKWTGAGTRWLTDLDAQGPHWMEIDLLDEYELAGAEVWSGEADRVAHVVSQFKLQYWDGGAWVDIPGASIADNKEAQVVFVFNEPVKTGKVRFYTEVKSEDDPYGVAVRLLEILVYAVTK